MDWIILQNPFILLILVTAILIACFDGKYKASKGVLSLLATLVYITALAFLCVGGAGYHELIVLLLVYLLFNINAINDRSVKE